MAGGDLRTTMSASRERRERPLRISRQKFPKRTRILSIPCNPYSFHSVHSATGSTMNGMIFRPFRKQNSSQKNTKTVYSEYSYSGIVPKERALVNACVQNTSSRLAKNGHTINLTSLFIGSFVSLISGLMIGSYQSLKGIYTLHYTFSARSRIGHFTVVYFVSWLRLKARLGLTLLWWTSYVNEN